jgi:hypothetical protein
MPVSWAVPLSKLRGVTYRYSIDGIPAGTTDRPGANRSFNLGDTLVSVTAHSSYNWDDGTATSQAWIRVVPSVDGTSTWAGAYVARSSANVATPSYGASVAIDGALTDAANNQLAGAVVTVQSSQDGTSFADLTPATNLPHGVYQAVVAPRARTWYRLAFAGLGGISNSFSDAVLVVPGVSLSRPASKSSVSHTKRLAVSGKLMPSHSSSSRTVKLRIKRWNGRRWADYSAPWTRVTRRNSAYATYAATLTLKKGAYRIYAYAPADGAHSATTSGYRAVAVK